MNKFSQGIEILHNNLEVFLFSVAHITVEQLYHILNKVVVVVVVVLKVHVVLQHCKVAFCEQLQESENILYLVGFLLEQILDFDGLFLDLHILNCVVDFVVDSHEEDLAAGVGLEKLPDTLLDVIVAPVDHFNSELKQVVENGF